MQYMQVKWKYKPVQKPTKTKNKATKEQINI